MLHKELFLERLQSVPRLRVVSVGREIIERPALAFAREHSSLVSVLGPEYPRRKILA